MKTFIIRIIAFAIVVGAIIIIIEILLGYSNPNEYRYKHNYLQTHLKDIKILGLGHSHIAYGINMVALNDSGFNAAIPSRNIFYDAEIVKEFVPKMSNLKTIILPLGYNFQYRWDVPDNQKCLMAKYWGYIFPGETPLIKLESLYGSKRKFADIIMQRSITLIMDSLGDHIISTHMKNAWNDKQELPMSKNKKNTMFIKEIKEIARVCRDHNIRLIAITMPCYTTYVAATTPSGISELHALADSMRSVYPEMEYYDFMADKRFDIEDFRDPSHLNELGALKFTAILKNELLPSR